MYAVITQAKLTPGRIDDVREIFRRTNGPLVAHQEDWVSAIFTANREDDTVTIVARWKKPESFRAFAKSEAYAKTMAEFAPYFRGPARVEINEILVDI
jgi:heme-degrading monooxygenase HmoA